MAREPGGAVEESAMEKEGEEGLGSYSKEEDCKEYQELKRLSPSSGESLEKRSG